MNEDVSGILLTQPELISDVLKPWVESSPEQTALVESSGTWTYGQLNAAVVETQLWLQNLGVRPGDRVMVVCENCRAFVAMFLALVGIDAWPVLVNARLSAREVDQIQSHCGARRVIYTTGVSAQAREHAKRHGAVVEKTDWLGSIGVGALNEEVESEPIEAERANRVAALIYTSGTTGIPKGVMLTHRNLLFIAAASANIRSLTPDDRLYGNLPMSHAVGLSVILLGTLLSGASVYLAPFFDPVAAFATLEKHRLTIFLGAPATFALLVEYATLKGMRSLKFPSLRIISSSGAPLHASLKLEVENLFGLTLHNGYGVTECSPNIAQTRIERPCQYVSVGNVLPGIEARLVGTNENLVPEGEVGELWVRGPNVMKGYYRAPDETAAAISNDGWFNTRDLAQLQDGKLFIVGRTKELIVRFGFNVYPAEVEGVLNAHPQITRSAVIGRTVEADGNEEIIAFVQPAPGTTLTCDQVAKYAEKHLAPYKQPSRIVLVSAMPLTPTGKVVKEELKKTAAYSAHAG
jgi:long-chain acyl-CoA synthetase